jgi:hypothetical protein
MRRTTHAIMGTLAAFVLGATLATAQAPDTNNMTIVTFSAPVSLPGVTLPAGSYMFKLADSQVNRNIVQVFDKDRSKILATILAIPAERNKPADDTVITFTESPANTAPAIRYWFYPGDSRGQEFAYPKKQAQEIANAAHTSVLAVDTEDTSADAMAKGELTHVGPADAASQSTARGAQSSTPQSATPSPTTEQPSVPAAQQSTQPPATAPQSESTPPSTQPRTTEQPSANPTPSAQAMPAPSTSTPSASTPSATQGAVGTSGRSSLPKTASTLPLVGFAGLLALASAFGVRALRRAQV